MFEISRILAPVVFSGNCRGALRYAVSVASRFGAEVTVMHVLEPLTFLDFDTDAELQRLEGIRRTWVDSELSSLARGLTDRVPIKQKCMDGDPATQIVRFAEASDIDLIVIATRGRGSFRRFLLGSVTAKVLHDTNRAVWTGVHLEHGLAPGASLDDLHSVICAVDFGPQAGAALEWASGMASAYNAKLSLLHVIPTAVDAERQRTACEEAYRRLEDLRSAINADAECHVAAGEVAEQVGSAVRRMGAGLLVIGRGHMKGGGRLRSTSYAILRGSPCPVVSV